MRLLFLVRSLHIGGAERQLVNLACGLKRKGHSISVASFYPDGPLQKDLDRDFIPHFSLLKRHRWDVIGFFYSLQHLVREEKPEIIHGYGSVPNVLTIMLKLLFPAAKMVWGVRASFLDLQKYDSFTRNLYRIECLLSRFPSLIIANSDAGRVYAVNNGFPASKLCVVHNGIDTLVFRANQGERKTIRNEWGIREGEVVVGMIGRLDPMKDHAAFTQSTIQAMQKSDRSLKAVCVGGGREELLTPLKQLVQSNGMEERFLWQGARADVARCMNGFDFLVSSSYGEGFPNVVAEAMSCGVPCVVTDVGDSAHIIGDCGTVVPPRDVDALTQAILGMAKKVSDEQIRATLSHCSRKRIENNFTNDRLIERTEELLQALLL